MVSFNHVTPVQAVCDWKFSRVAIFANLAANWLRCGLHQFFYGF